MCLLTRLKFLNVKKDDLLKIFKIYILNVLEYCLVVWHSSLTQAQSEQLKRVQRVAFKVILGLEYTDYEQALQYLNMETLAKRRENKCISFGKKCANSQRHQHLFPRAMRNHEHNLRHPEPYEVNPARTESYKKSTVPYIQRLLNQSHN